MTFDELRAVNAKYNAVPFMQGLEGDDWNPATLDMMGILSGANCNSYATAKLQALYKAGWPLNTLRLMVCNHPMAEVRPNGNHVCLLVDYADETYVLCNTLAEPALMEKVPYAWLKVQDHKSPTGWSEA